MGIYAVPFRTDIGDAHDRQGVTVCYPAYQVPLAGNGDNRIWPSVHDNLPGGCASSIDKEFYPIFPSEVEELDNFTPSALPAVLIIPCDIIDAVLDILRTAESAEGVK